MRIAALFLLAAFAPAAAATAPPDAAAIALLRESIVAPQHVSYIGELQTVRFSSSRATASIVRVEHRAPEMTRRWYLAPESVYGDYTISRGEATYDFDTKNSRVTISHNPSGEDQVTTNGMMSLLLSNYRAMMGADDSIAGHTAKSVLLINKFSGERAMRVWIDAGTKLVLKKEEYHGDGSVATRSRFEELRYTSAIPLDIFATTAPQGYEQIQGHDAVMPSSDIDRVLADAGFPPAGPKDLPEGFALVSASTNVVDGTKTLHLLYSDGLRNLSLFENATGAAADFGSLHPKTVQFEGHDAEYVEDGSTTLLTWEERDLHFALVGDLSRRELIAIATSVVP